MQQERKNFWDALYIIHIPDVYHQFLVMKGKDIYLTHLPLNRP